MNIYPFPVSMPEDLGEIHVWYHIRHPYRLQLCAPIDEIRQIYTLPKNWMYVLLASVV